jgi:uncharacterized protein YkwD
MSGNLINVSVTLDNIQYSSSELDIALVSPHGESVMLLSDVSASMLSPGTLPFDNSGADMPDSNPDTSGLTVYTPHNVAASNSDSFPNGGPTSPTSALTDFNDQSPDGTWKLYEWDGSRIGSPEGPIGSLGGWTLHLTTDAAQMEIAPNSGDFGALNVGQTSAIQDFTITNAGANPMTMGTPAMTGPDADQFEITSSDCAGAMLMGDQSCKVSARFKPTSRGPKAAVIALGDDAPGGPHGIGLSGTAIGPALSAVPGAVDFGSVVIPQSGAAQTVTLTNNGDGPLTFTQAPSVSGPDAGDFNLTGSTCGDSLAGGASCSFNVGFAPGSPGQKSATVTMGDTAPGSPHSVPLTGVAVPGSPPPQESGSSEIKVDSVGFESAQVGKPTYLDVTASDATSQVTGVLVDFGNSLDSYGASACTEGKNPPGSSTFHIPYVFLTPGDHTINLTIFAGGCGAEVAHNYTFVVHVASAGVAARRLAQSAATEVTLTGPPITSRCKDQALLPTKSKANRIIKALLCVMNEQRKLAKLKPLKLSPRLTRAALTHTQAMITGRFFAHQGPREPALVRRLAKVKYRGAAGENIGAGGGTLGSPLAMVNGWMHSSLHRANLLSRSWKFVGIGFLPKFPIPTAGQPLATYTTDFGTKR